MTLTLEEEKRLLDWAGQAMAGVLADSNYDPDAERLSKLCFNFAEGMVEEWRARGYKVDPKREEAPEYRDLVNGDTFKDGDEFRLNENLPWLPLPIPVSKEVFNDVRHPRHRRKIEKGNQ